MQRARITIEYCVECMYLASALELVRALLEAHPDQIESLKLIPGHEGVFDVTLNDQKIFVMEGVLPRPDLIMKKMSEVFSGGALA